MAIWTPVLFPLLDSKSSYGLGLLSDSSLNSSQGLESTLHRAERIREFTFIESLSANQPERCHLILQNPNKVGTIIISSLQVRYLRLQDNK